MRCPGRVEGGPHSLEVDAQASKDLPCCALDVEEAEQDVLGLDLLVVAAQREPRRSLQGAFGPVGELEIADLAGVLGDCLGHLVP